MSGVANTVEPAARPARVEHVHKLLQKDFQQTEYSYARISATLPAGWTFEDALKPEFWANVSHVLQKRAVTNEPDRAGAIIELRTVDHAFYAELYVRAVLDPGLIVGVLRKPVYFGLKEVESPSYEIRWNVGKRGYDIIRKSDREIVGDSTKVKTKEQAQEWIDKTARAA